MTEAIREQAHDWSDIPRSVEILARIRTTIGKATPRSPAEVSAGWAEAARDPAKPAQGLTLVQWSALLPFGSLEAADFPEDAFSEIADLLSVKGGDPFEDHAAAAEAGLDLLFAALTEQEIARAHGILAFHALRIADRERARTPTLALAVLERAAGRDAIALILQEIRRGAAASELMRLGSRLGAAESERPDLFGPLRAVWDAMFPEQATAPRASRLSRSRTPGAPPSATFGGPAPSAPPARTETVPPASPGAVLFNPPEQMKVGTCERIEVRLGDAETSTELLKDQLRGKGVPQIETIEITPHMRVRLLGDPEDFTIRALSHEDQLIRPGQPARWDFDVTPEREGVRTLRLLVSLRVRIGSGVEVVDLPAFERQIAVAVAPWLTASRFFARHWKWFVTALFIPLLLWAGNKGVNYFWSPG